MPGLRVSKFTSNRPHEILKSTIELIGRGIKNGAVYVPLRIHAARIASQAKPKDYYGQVQAIYNDFVKRWRYVQDPLGTELVTVTGPEIYQQILGADRSSSHGFGDCDDATVACGSMLRSIGFEVAICTVQRPIGAGLFSHVFLLVNIPGAKWISFDPVGFPAHQLGWTPPYRRLAVWSLEGKLLHLRGVIPRGFERMKQNYLPKKKEVNHDANVFGWS